jgi:hypothetical protein
MIKEQKNTIIESENQGIVLWINANGELENLFIEDYWKLKQKINVEEEEAKKILEIVSNLINKLVPAIEEKRLEIVNKYKPEIEKLKI